MARLLALLLALGACIEEGTKEHDEYCWKDEHCVETLLCYENVCLTQDEADAEEAAADAGGGDGNTGILCNDGTRSPTCTTCTSGCCSGHGGCK